MTCPYARRLGPFALDVDDAESGLIERHLDTCRSCQAELADLTRVADVLAAVRGSGVLRDDALTCAGAGNGSVGKEDEAVPPHHPNGEPAASDDLLDRVLDAIAAERATTTTAERATTTTAGPAPRHPHRSRRTRRRPARPRRRTVVALVAAAVLLGGTATGVAVWADRGSAPLVARSWLGVSATATIAPRETGSRIDMVLSGLPPKASCRLVARAGDGRVETVASWRVTYQDTFRFEARTSIPVADLASLDVLDNRGRRLARFTPTPDDQGERTPR